MFKTLPKNCVEFRDSILSECIYALKMNTFYDNFDVERFNYDGIDRSKVFNARERAFWLTWFYDNFESLYTAFALFKHDRSKQLFLTLVAFRIAGHHSVRIQTRFNENDSDFLAYQLIETWTESQLQMTGMFGKLKHYDFMYKDNHYIADCLGFKYCLYRGQYFFRDRGINICPEESDFVIDAGACLGETTIVFAKAVGKEGKVYAFDPVEDHLQVLIYNCNQNPDCNIQLMPFGLSDSNVYSQPVRLQSYSPGFSSRNRKVPLRTLDSLVSAGDIQKIDFIKMDIEGSEMSALIGSTNSIRKFKPKLAISLYHKPNDIFEIPLYVANAFPFYTLYMEHYTIHAEESVLYCMPN